MKHLKRAFLLVAAIALLAAGNDSGNQLLTYADLATYVTSGQFVLQSGVTITATSQVVTASAFRADIKNSGTPGYADGQAITYGDAIADASSGGSGQTPTPAPTSTPQSPITPRPTPTPTPLKTPLPCNPRLGNCN